MHRSHRPHRSHRSRRTRREESPRALHSGALALLALLLVAITTLLFVAFPPGAMTRTEDALLPTARVLGQGSGVRGQRSEVRGQGSVAVATVTDNVQLVPFAVQRPIPILMYHYVRTVDAASDQLGYALSVTPENFAAQMNWLKQNGYATVRMDELTRCTNGIAACPARAVALTLDDGYADAFTTAFPILQRHGFTATFYIISERVGQPGYMGWNELAALRDAGMEIGAHSISHPDLTTLDPAESNRQIAQSKADLELSLGITITSFCYPSGRYHAAIAQQVSAAGYWNATTTRWDNDWSDIFGLPRRRISGNTRLDSFATLMQ